MKKTGKLLLILAVFLMCGIILVACSDVVKTPSELIKDVYGNTEFTLSFSAEGIEEPIADIKYTANSMPSLPTPQRLGYIFGGWYLDENYTTRYTDGILYLYMKNITLYAKWEKEDFSQDGVYDIELDCEIVQDSVKYGEIVTEIGYKNFADSIVAEQTWIEVVGGERLLKIQYDCGVTVPYGQKSVFTVAPSAKSSSYVHVQEIIASDAETLKNIFINIDKLFEGKDYDISQPIYLDIAATDWETPDILNSDREKTTVQYTVEIRISRFIGLSNTYIDHETPLEDGFYLVKAHYLQESARATMMETYNPVYGYIYAKNGKYKLIKQFTPYAGLVGVENKILSPFTLNYYHRAMTYSLIQLYFGIDYDFSSGEVVESNYYPETYNADYYGDFITEFHADSGKYYAIYDLNEDLTKQIMFMGAVTGFMEVAGAMGQMNMVMTLDYEHIVKLAYVDYEPLVEDAFMLGDEFVYYPGELEDLQDDTAYETASEYGVSQDLVNFYYSASSQNESVYSRTLYSHRITVTPKASANAQTVAQSRYKPVAFDTRTEIFGYDGKANLYADNMSLNVIGGSGMRNTTQVVVGKSFNIGDTVDLAALYAEKVDATFDSSGVICEIYQPDAAGKFTYSSGTLIKKDRLASIAPFAFDSRVAVVFSTSRTLDRLDGTQGYYEAKTVVELAEYAAPEFSLHLSGEEDCFDPDKVYVVGDKVPYPVVTYNWMGKSGGFIDNYFDSENDATGINISRVMLVYTNSDGSKSISWTFKEDLAFELTKTGVSVVYEAVNRFGEKASYAIDVKTREVADARPSYTVEKNGEDVYSGTVYLDKEGNIRPLDFSSGYFLMSASSLVSSSYNLVIGDSAPSVLRLVSYSVKTENIAVEENADGLSVEDLIEQIKTDVGDNYAYVTLVYGDGKNTVTEKYLMNVTFSGSMSPTLMNYDTYFTKHEYNLTAMGIYSLDGRKIGTFAKSIRVSNDMGSKAYSLVQNAKQFTLNFNYIGDYKLSFSADIRYLENGGYVFADGSSVIFGFTQDIKVKDGYGDVTVVYHTDAEHPFAGGGLEKEVVYSLTGKIVTLRKTDFQNYNSIKDLLFGWAVSSEYIFKDDNYYAGGELEDFIGDFNSDKVHLYSIWDEGIVITPDLRYDLTGKTGKPVRFYLHETNTYYRGKYNIELSDFVAPEVKGWTFVGWEADGELVSANETLHVTQAFTLKAVYKQQFIVRYDIDQTASYSWFTDDVVLDGETLPENRVPLCKNGWEFVGWQKVLYGENGLEIGTEAFDSALPIVANTVLRAVFREI